MSFFFKEILKKIYYLDFFLKSLFCVYKYLLISIETFYRVVFLKKRENKRNKHKLNKTPFGIKNI